MFLLSVIELHPAFLPAPSTPALVNHREYSWLNVPNAVHGLIQGFKNATQPWNMLGMAEEEITARLQVARHLAKENVLSFLVEVDQRIAKENNVEQTIERPLGVYKIDQLELDKPWLCVGKVSG